MEAPALARGQPQEGGLTRYLEGRAWIGIRLGVDLLMLVCGCVVALATGDSGGAAALLIAYPPLVLLLLSSRGRYSERLRDVILDSIAPGFGAISIGAMAVFVLAIAAHASQADTDALMVRTWIASLALVTAAGGLLTTLQHVARKRRWIQSRALIVGADATGREIARHLRDHPEYGLEPVGFLDSATRKLPSQVPLPVLGDCHELTEVAVAQRVRHVIVGFPQASHRELLVLVNRCDALGLETTVVPRLSGSINHQTRFEYLGTLPVLNLRAIRTESWQFAVKHLLDRVTAAILLILLAPLFGLIALAVRLSSPGPILFRQPRAGRDGQLFDLLKFRTMLVAAALVDDFAPGLGLAPGGVEGIDRRTRVGRLLRRTSLDELPQLFNVLRGEMSLVGPRPERPEFAEIFRRQVDRYQDRNRVRSGITGWAQVHGFRGQTPLADRIELDNFYIEHWSLALDVKILLLTIPALLKGS